MADVSGNLKDWSTTALSNSPSGTDAVGTGLAPNLQEIQKVVRQDLATKGADIASATTTDIGAVAGLMHDITGTTTITGFGTVSAGIWKILKFEGVLTLTHNSTSLILPGGVDITTAVGDVGVFISEGSGNWRCVSYTPHRGVLRTEQATTSGATVDFTDIPSWAKKITIMFDGVSLDGTEELMVQLGDSGGFETSGYVGTVATAAGTDAGFTSGFLVSPASTATQSFTGAMVITLMDSTNNTWIAASTVAETTADDVVHGAGSKSLTGTLTQVRVTSSNTPDDFDAGAVNILIE